MYSRLLAWLVAAAFVGLPGLCGAAQSELQQRTLVINGHRGTVTIYRISGQSYINLESLARTGNGSLSFQGDEIILTFSAAPSASTSPGPAADEVPRMSKEFMTAAIEALARVRHWYTTIGQALQKGVPGDGSRLAVFRDRSAEGVRLASIAASTGPDKDALQLLSNHFTDVEGWYQKLMDERKTLSTANYSMNEELLAKDPEYQKITTCSNFLGAMLASGDYEEDASCRWRVAN